MACLVTQNYLRYVVAIQAYVVGVKPVPQLRICRLNASFHLLFLHLILFLFIYLFTGETPIWNARLVLH